MRQQLIDTYKHACSLDIQALKPGNVGQHVGTDELVADDFLHSAEVSAPPLTQTDIALGERILQSVQATRQAVGTNTNLGIILLIAPVIQAILSLSNLQTLEESLTDTLQRTSVMDAKNVYRAIRLAKPGGMGVKKYQNLADEPSVSLLNAMKISESSDRIAAQYSNNFHDIFSFGVPRYQSLLAKWQDQRWATTGVFLGFLARFPDSLICRKFGMLKAQEINDMITPLEREFCCSDSPGRYGAQLLEIDGHLKRDRINPGTSADLTVASIFIADLRLL